MHSTLNTITGLGMCNVCAGQETIDKGTRLPAVEASRARGVTACPKEEQQHQQNAMRHMGGLIFSFPLSVALNTVKKKPWKGSK